jgi:hypothetical protein
MNNQIEFGQTGLIENTSAAASPKLEASKVGLRLNISKLQLNGSRLQFTLHITGKFEASFVENFHRIHFAPVILIQDLDGAASTLKPIDTHKRYIPHPGPNWVDKQTGRKDMYTTFWIQIPLWVRVTRPKLQPSLFVSASLQKHISNMLILDTKACLFSSV